MEFNTSSDLPLQLRGGISQETAIYNRIATINRINYLVQQTIPNFDIRLKSQAFLMAFDLEMWKRFYKDKPKDTVVDEEFCQKAAEVCREMEGVEPVVNRQEFTVAFQMSQVTPQKPVKKKFIDKLIGFLNKHEVKL